MSSLVPFPISASALIALYQDSSKQSMVSLTMQSVFFTLFHNSVYPPSQIRELVPESQAYMDLLAFERKLDQTIMRKRVDIQEALKRPMKVSRSKYT